MTLLASALVLWALPKAEANTRFAFGTITEVDSVKSNFTVVVEAFNLQARQILGTTGFNFHGKHNKFGSVAYFLDGKLSTPEEAIKVGRGICACANFNVMIVSSQPGPQVPGAVGAPGNGIYRVELPNAFEATMARVEGGAIKSEYAAQKMPVTLFADCRDGKVVNAVAILTGLVQSDYPVDPAGLRLQDGKLTGEIALQATFSEQDRYQTKDRQPVAVKCAVDKGTVSIIAPSPAREACRVWLYFEDFGVGSHGYVVLPAAGGKVQDGYVLFAKGNRIGTAKAKGLTLKDGRLEGTLALELKDMGGKPVTTEFTLNGAVYGGRLIFGTTGTRTFRGGIYPADGPQLETTTPEQDEIIKKMRAEKP
jgi:hypothetical protein